MLFPSLNIHAVMEIFLAVKIAFRQIKVTHIGRANESSIPEHLYFPASVLLKHRKYIGNGLMHVFSCPITACHFRSSRI